MFKSPILSPTTLLLLLITTSLELDWFDYHTHCTFSDESHAKKQWVTEHRKRV